MEGNLLMSLLRVLIESVVSWTFIMWIVFGFCYNDNGCIYVQGESFLFQEEKIELITRRNVLRYSKSGVIEAVNLHPMDAGWSLGLANKVES